MEVAVLENVMLTIFAHATVRLVELLTKHLKRRLTMSNTPQRPNDPTEIIFYGKGHVKVSDYLDMKAYATKLEAERDAARAALAWQPIETAPKDGAVILVWRPSLAIIRVQIACFVNDKWETYGSGPMWEGYFPTHWQPLPPSPAQKEG